MRKILTALCLPLAIAVAAVMMPHREAGAVFSGDMSPRAESGDKDYAAAIRFRKEKDWMSMVNSLNRVVRRRPWHDNAHNLLGYGYRKMHLYELALKHYHTALELNPRHRQALEYLGEAYLQMGDVAKAEETMERLANVCGAVSLAFSDGDFSDGCDEYRDLREAYDFYLANGVPMADEDEFDE
ncbi:MAG: tetratricopeptide repeat protein [Pseudomonadota bacterium]